MSHKPEIFAEARALQTKAMLAGLLNTAHGPLAGKMPRDLFDEFDGEMIVHEVKKIGESLTKKLEKQAEEIKAQGETSKKTSQEIKALEQKYDTLQTELQGKLEELEAKASRLGGPGGQGEQKSVGQQLIETAEYKSGGYNKGAVKLQVKTLLTSSSTSAGAFQVPTRLPLVVRPNVRTPVRSLLPTGTITTGALEYIRETGFTNNAAPVAEGGLKPESGITLEVITDTVKTIAHWIPITRQAAEDADRVMAYVENRLLQGLQLQEDTQILFGSGTGQNLAGIVTLATAYSRRQAGDTFIDTLRRAMTQVSLAELLADGIVVNPADWETIELAKDDNGRYIWVSVNDGGILRLFKVPVIVTTAMPQNQFLVGGFQGGAQLLDRQEATVEMSDQDRDNFIRNTITLRAEERVGLEVYRPEAFVTGEFEETP